MNFFRNKVLVLLGFFVLVASLYGAELTAEQAKTLVRVTPQFQRAKVHAKHLLFEVGTWPDQRLYSLSIYDKAATGPGTGSGKILMFFVEKKTGKIFDTVPYENPVETPEIKALREAMIKSK